MVRQITISIEEYNKLIDMHTKREELPEKIEVKKISSKWWRWLKRASCSLLHYNKNAEQQAVGLLSGAAKFQVKMSIAYGLIIPQFDKKVVFYFEKVKRKD